MGIETRLAWRNVWRNPRRTALSVAATVFAVFLVILTVGMASGVHEKIIEDAVRLASGHVALSGRGYRHSMTLEQFLPWDGRIEQAIENTAGVRAWAPRISSFALISIKDRSQGGMVIGVSPEQERNVTTFAEKVVTGRFLKSQANPAAHEVVLGRRLADRLGAKLGDEVLLYGVAYSLETAYALFEVVGTMALPDPRLEKNLAIVHIDAARDFYVYENRITEVAILAENADASVALLAELERALATSFAEDELELETYAQMMPELVQLILIDDAGMYITLTILVVVVGFGILNTILMAILERAHELGVVLALGLKPMALFRMIYVESMLLAGLGLVIGLSLALPLLAWLQGIEIPLTGDAAKGTTELFGMQAVMTFKLEPSNPILSTLTILFVAALAALYPAIKASRAHPVDALRSL
ncbi:MAG: ABC transporter permease [Myxococcales bacterium]|nr:ABC transporter permease [Myxococcales bacterium]HIK83825.1 ABC transporter permease [Myxococcales bacterium]